MPYRFLLPAALELERAADYYRHADIAIATRFLDEVDATIRRILAYPFAWMPVDSGIRRSRVKRFPFGVVYFVESDLVVIVSVMNLHRHPDSWRSNLKRDR